MATQSSSSEQVARLLRQCLEEGAAVEIDGLGLFRPDGNDRFEFVARNQPKVFMAYAREDTRTVEKLFDDLQANGFDPWLDIRKLLPGQNWPRAIDRAIEICDFFLACFSRRSTVKRSRFHSELRYALDCATRLPLDGIYFIPVRLDECEIPEQIADRIQYVDLFPDWDKGLDQILSAMKNEWKKRGC